MSAMLERSAGDTWYVVETGALDAWKVYDKDEVKCRAASRHHNLPRT